MNWNDPCVNPKCIEWERQALVLRAQVADLKARLKAARRADDYGLCMKQRRNVAACSCPDCIGYRATDLRVRNWRRP